MLCFEAKCASPLQTGGGAVVCSLEFPGLFAMAKGNVYYSCNMLRAVDFNCFSKCVDNCDIWKRSASCTNKLYSTADLVHTAVWASLQNFTSSLGSREGKEGSQACPTQPKK